MLIDSGMRLSWDLASAVFRDCGAAVFARNALVGAFNLYRAVTENAIGWRDLSVL